MIMLQSLSTCQLTACTEQEAEEFAYHQIGTNLQCEGHITLPPEKRDVRVGLDLFRLYA